MIRYPRVLIIKRIKYIPIYQELYQVDSMRQNRPTRSKFGLSKSWKSHTNLTHPVKVF